MNIAFWSNSKGLGGTTSNMLAVSTMASTMYVLKTILIQTDNISKPIDDVLEGKKSEFFVNEEYRFYSKAGLDEIVERSRLKLLNSEVVESNIVNVRHTNIHYIPTAKEHIITPENEVKGAYEELMRKLSSTGELCFWDLKNGESEVSKTIMKNSDVIVINLPQDANASFIDDEELRKKCVYVIGKYDSASKYGIMHFCKNHKIARNRLGVIPYNIKFHDAVNDGKLIPFIMKNVFSKKHEANYEFVNSLYETTNMILNKAGVIGIGK